MCFLCLSKPEGNGEDDDNLVEEQKTSDGKSPAVTSHYKLKTTPSWEKVFWNLSILKRSASVTVYFSAGLVLLLLEDKPSHAVHQQKYWSFKLSKTTRIQNRKQGHAGFFNRVWKFLSCTDAGIWISLGQFHFGPLKAVSREVCLRLNYKFNCIVCTELTELNLNWLHTL